MSLEEELKEGAEHAHRSGEKGIGLTMAIVAVLLAIATLMGQRTHTQEGLIQKSLDEECGTPPEHGCSSPARDSAILRPLLTPVSTTESKEDKKEQHASAKQESPAQDQAAKEQGKEAAAKEEHENKSSSHKPGAVNIQESAKEMERERDLVERRANYYDGAELFLEISIVLCSIALLAEAKLFWQLSFISTILGVGVALFGFLGVH